MQTEIHDVETPTLRIAFEQTGPPDGEPIVLLHGFPYDVRSFDETRNLVAREGRRIIVPYSRGFGPTQYRSADIMRSGQQAALGKDVIDLLDGLAIERATLVGYDWGSRAACVAAALWPHRVCGLVTVGGYTIQDIAKATTSPATPGQERQLWYQWYFQTERGRLGLDQNRDSLCELLWQQWSPTWHFSPAVFAASAPSFRNPNFVATVIHSYRHRYANIGGDPNLEEWERQLAAKPKISVPTITLHGEEDQVDPPSTSERQEQQFTGPFERRLFAGVGHCAPAEAPRLVAEAIDQNLRMR